MIWVPLVCHSVLFLGISRARTHEPNKRKSKSFIFHCTMIKTKKKRTKSKTLQGFLSIFFQMIPQSLHQFVQSMQLTPFFLQTKWSNSAECTQARAHQQQNTFDVVNRHHHSQWVLLLVSAISTAFISAEIKSNTFGKKNDAKKSPLKKNDFPFLLMHFTVVVWGQTFSFNQQQQNTNMKRRWGE